MKPYHKIPIVECGEPLVPIPSGRLAFFEPHPYVSLGAPYNGVSPWMLRKSVLDALLKAQDNLEKRRKGWKIKLFDAYRPTEVQDFMVEQEFVNQAKAEGIDLDQCAPETRRMLTERVLRIWAPSYLDKAKPPPHSTGGVLDGTLADESGFAVEMGSPIDENSERSLPDHFASSTIEAEIQAHRNREFLHEIMREVGFQRLLTEWWHFSIGDQNWAWREREESGDMSIVARYGRVDIQL